MRLECNGVVKIGDKWRVSSEDDILRGAIYIGDTDLVDEIAERKWAVPVRVTLNGEEIANGDAVINTGWGSSEYTPLESDSLEIGDCDLLERLKAIEGQAVELVIEDT